MLKFVASLSLALLSACLPAGPQPPEGVPHPGEDSAGVGMRLQLVPTATSTQGLHQTVRNALQEADAGLPPGTYLCVCPPPNLDDLSHTRVCTCQEEGAPALPDDCGDGVLNTETENCDPGLARTCPDYMHCITGGEVVEGVAYPACFNCVLNDADGGR